MFNKFRSLKRERFSWESPSFFFFLRETSLCLIASMLKLAGLAGWEQTKKSPSLRQTAWNECRRELVLPPQSQRPDGLQTNPESVGSVGQGRSAAVLGNSLSERHGGDCLGVQSSAQMVRNGTDVMTLGLYRQAFCFLRSQTPRVTDPQDSGHRKGYCFPWLLLHTLDLWKSSFLNKLISLEDYCQVTDHEGKCKIIFVYYKAKDRG